jgi:hypothetical protein
MEGYGPNDGEVLRFLERVSRLTVDEAAAIARARPPDALMTDRNERRLDRAALMADRRAEMEAARDAISGAIRFGGTPWFGRVTRVFWDRRIPGQDAETMRSVAPALLDAIGALVVRDVLDPVEFDVLMAPWLAAVSDSGVEPGAAS